MTKSILNLGHTALEDQKGVIAGTQTTMEVYNSGGNWTPTTNGTYEVEKPGEYEIRYKGTEMELASKSTKVTVHSYYTESSNPVDNGLVDDKSSYKYTVELFEKDSSGATKKVSKTVLDEDVMFGLAYPSGLKGKQYSYKLYHLPDTTTEIPYTVDADGIYASVNDYTNTEFLLVVVDNIPITFKGNGGTTNDKLSEYVQYVVPNKETSLEENKFANAHYIFTGWNTVEDGDQEKKGTHYNEGAKVTLKDEGLTLYAQWIGPVTISGSSTGTGTLAYVGETLTANVDNAEGIDDFTYQWAYYGTTAAGTGWHAIPDETNKTYVPTDAYTDKQIACFVTRNDGRARSNEKTVTDTLDSVTWVQDIINDGNTATYPSATYYTQSEGVKHL